MVTLRHNPVMEGKAHSGYAMGWFFGVSSNSQASAAVWGWGEASVPALTPSAGAMITSISFIGVQESNFRSDSELTTPHPVGKPGQRQLERKLLS